MMIVPEVGDIGIYSKDCTSCKSSKTLWNTENVKLETSAIREEFTMFKGKTLEQVTFDGFNVLQEEMKIYF
jgi:hypothetical protein